MDRKQLTALEREAIADAGRFAVVFAISFAALASPALSAAGNVSDAKAIVVSAAIAGTSQAIGKTKPLWAKLGSDILSAIGAARAPKPEDPSAAAPPA